MRPRRHRIARGSIPHLRTPPLDRTTAGLRATQGLRLEIGPGWQRAAVAAVTAFASVSVAAMLWSALGPLIPVLGLFFGGWLLSCLLEPLVARITEHVPVRRPTAITATYLLLLLAIALAWVALAPALAGSISSSVANLPALIDAAAQRAVSVQFLANAWLAERGLGLQLDLASNLSLTTLAQRLRTQLGTAEWNPAAVLSAAVGVLASVGMILLLSVFFLIGGRPLADQVTQAFGTRAAADVRFVLATTHDAFEGFVRAQVLQGVLYAGGVWACLAVAQVDGAPLFALMAGVLLLVPVLGAVLALLVPVGGTLVWHPQATLVVVVILVLLQQLVLNVVGPRLMSRQLGMPPLLVLFGIAAGGQVGGLWGALFGIPTLAILLACADHFKQRWSNNWREED